MKKILLIMVFLIALISMLLAEDMQLQEISLDEFLTEYMPDYKIIKQIQLEGIGRDFAVAKETGEIVAINEIAGQLKVSLFDYKGSEKWSKWFPNYYVAECVISENGQTIVLHLGEDMYVNNIIISNDGQQLYETRRKDKWLIPSPEGNYLYWRFGDFCSFVPKTLQLYDNYGKEITFSGFSSKANILAIRFITNEKILICYDDETKNNQNMYIEMYSIFGNSLNRNWGNMISKNHNVLFNFDWKKSAVSEKYIAIYGTCSSSLLYVFDFNGNIVFQNEKLYRSIRFINESTLIAMTTDWKPNGIDIININNRNIESFDFPLIYKNCEWDMFDAVSMKDEKIFLDIIRVPYSRNRYRTIIWDFDEEKVKLDYQFVPLLVDNKNLSYLFKYDLNPEIIILEEEVK